MQLTQKMSKASPRGGLGLTSTNSIGGFDVTTDSLANIMNQQQTQYGWDAVMNTNQASSSSILTTGPSVPLFDSNGNIIPGTGLVNVGQASSGMFANNPGGNAVSGAVNLYDNASNLLVNGQLPSSDSIDWQGILGFAGVALVGFFAIKIFTTFK